MFLLARVSSAANCLQFMCTCCGLPPPDKRFQKTEPNNLSVINKKLKLAHEVTMRT